MIFMRIATISRGGQISIPADIRHRWGVRRVALLERDGSLVVQPIPDDPIGAALGSLAGPGPTTDEIRSQLRAEELGAYERKGWA
jgi:bifunctional DNA-binding transcriptional regulator/antitoxin component of YhaV-PrlF toxin-antitoxin module